MKKGITLAVIPARGGSKRLKKKNIRRVLQGPLLKYTLDAAEDSDLVDEAIVSSDSPEIAKIARQCGGQVLFERPSELATDTASNYDVLRHAVGWWEENRGPVDVAVLLQPTSPLRSAEDIDECIRLFKRAKPDAVVSVAPASPPPWWVVTLDSENRPKAVVERKDQFRTRKQDLPDTYVPNGAVYVLKRNFLMAGHTAFEGDTRCFVMPRERSIDVDEETDLILVRELLRRGRRSRP